MWLKLCFLLLYFLLLFVLARVFEAVVWYETGFFATQLVDPVALSFRKLRTILECRGLGHSGLPEKKDVRELVEKSGDLMEGELYSALKEEEASESVSSTNFSGEMHFYELVEDTKDGIWLVQILQEEGLAEVHPHHVSSANQHLQRQSHAQRIQRAQDRSGAHLQVDHSPRCFSDQNHLQLRTFTRRMEQKRPVPGENLPVCQPRPASGLLLRTKCEVYWKSRVYFCERGKLGQ
ncbi:E3 ubiquitin-protein ligase RNF103 isoform X3 [Anas acuta]|uniref:E3 ubiquitin-protein ligase RNF103 isoform X3 n=1 Tax=Anas acuta TaxID=28680 RepID=UPI0035C8946E